MHLAVEAVGNKHGGGATILCEFLQAAVEDPRLGQITVFTSPRGTRTFDLPQSPKLKEIQLPWAESSRVLRIWWYEHGLSHQLHRIRADFLLCLNGAGVAGPGVPQVTFVQQALPFSPDAFKLGGVAQCLRLTSIRLLTTRSVHRSDKVLVQSPVMAHLVSTVCRVPLEKVEAVVPCVNELPQYSCPNPEVAPMRLVPPDRRVLYVGGDSPHKNIHTLVGAIQLLRQRLPDVGLIVTLPPNHPICRLPGVIGLGYLPRPALREAYELATCVVMPSLVETVGLPMLEAMSVGTAVVAADRPYAHVICGQAARYFDPHDSASIAETIASVLLDPSLRCSLSSLGRQVAVQRISERPYARMVDALFEVAGK